ncbi:MAG: TIM barrel protein [Bacteroidota bacterium]
MKRRSFLRKAAVAGGTLSLTGTWLACGETNTNTQTTSTMESVDKSLKISLAQWSLHRQLFDQQIKAEDFPAIAKERYGIGAVEYVNQFYTAFAKDENFWIDLKRRADDVGVKSLLIMVDDEGDLGVADDALRQQAVENHYKWVDAAKLLGCHSIRVNAFGESDKEKFKAALADGMGRLADYAAQENINVLIENHGLFSSDASLIVDVIRQVGKSNFGTFPDFGNWCTSAKWGSTNKECETVYDIYQGVAEFLPFAKAVSAKSYDFTAAGAHPKIDYARMLKLVKESAYDGYIGIEYEGESLSEHEGILATKALMEKTWAGI